MRRQTMGLVRYQNDVGNEMPNTKAAVTNIALKLKSIIWVNICGL